MIKAYIFLYYDQIISGNVKAIKNAFGIERKYFCHYVILFLNENDEDNYLTIV